MTVHAGIVLITGAIVIAAAAAVGWAWKELGDSGHADLMNDLGHPVPELPRRFTRKDWRGCHAELDSLTETAKD